jgi:hypothetical protein
MSGKMRWDRVERERRMRRSPDDSVESGGGPSFYHMSPRRRESMPCTAHSWVAPDPKAGGWESCSRCGQRGIFVLGSDARPVSRVASKKKTQKKKRKGRKPALRSGGVRGTGGLGLAGRPPAMLRELDVSRWTRSNALTEVRTRGPGNWLWRCVGCRIIEVGLPTEAAAQEGAELHRC